jgi:hypothetical protein
MRLSVLAGGTLLLLDFRGLLLVELLAGSALLGLPVFSLLDGLLPD